MNLSLSSSFVKSSLNGHSLLGIVLGALMYLICLTGTLVVFFEEFERWEQPNIEEFKQFNAEQIERSVSEFLNKTRQSPESLYVVLPTEAVPRVHVSGDQKEWFVSQQGELLEPPNASWTHLLKELHINLHLPQTFGIIIVGALGAMLCGLIVSGILAHPRIFKDAFTFRRGGNYRLEQADLHNRLSVWGTPFYFMIALTGAYIGLVGLLIALIAPLEFEGDRDAVVDYVYGADPVVKRTPTPINYQAIIDTLATTNQQAKPIYWVIQNINTPAQFVEVAATLPNRLIYSEMYRFNSDGTLINHQGLSDGPVGRQMAYSVYRLHFGHFHSGWVKIFYGLLGLALTVISATGINIWLTKRKYKSPLNDAWVGFVWGVPLALIIAAIVAILGTASFAVFWLTLISVVAIGGVTRTALLKVSLLGLSAVSLVGLLIVYLFTFGELTINSGSTLVNLAIFGLVVFYSGLCWRYFKRIK